MVDNNFSFNIAKTYKEATSGRKAELSDLFLYVCTYVRALRSLRKRPTA